MSSAEFSLDGDPFANLGFDTTAGAVITFLLTDAGFDIYSCTVEVVQKTGSAPDIVELGAIGGGGASPSPLPTSPLTFTMPAIGVHSYIIRCTVNGGKDAVGTTVAAYVKERLVAIKVGTQRKICPAETTQYDAEQGWCEAFNSLVGVPAIVTPASSTDHALVRWDGVSGVILQNSVGILTDGGALSGLTSVALGAVPATTGAIRLTDGEGIYADDGAGGDVHVLSESGNSVTLGDAALDDIVIRGNGVPFILGGVTRFTLSSTHINIGASASVANTGLVRLPKAFSFYGLDHAGTGSFPVLASDASDYLTVGGNDADLEKVILSVPTGKTVDVQVNAATVASFGTTYLGLGATHAFTGTLRLPKLFTAECLDNAGAGVIPVLTHDASDYLTLGGNDADLEKVRISVPTGKTIDLTMAGDNILMVGATISARRTLEMLATTSLDCATNGAYLKPRRLRQDAEPTPEVGELMLWCDSDDSDKVYIMYRDSTAGTKKLQLT
jgi:hypothetical protein